MDPATVIVVTIVICAAIFAAMLGVLALLKRVSPRLCDWVVAVFPVGTVPIYVWQRQYWMALFWVAFALSKTPVEGREVTGYASR